MPSAASTTSSLPQRQQSPAPVAAPSSRPFRSRHRSCSVLLSHGSRPAKADGIATERRLNGWLPLLSLRGDQASVSVAAQRFHTARVILDRFTWSCLAAQVCVAPKADLTLGRQAPEV